MGGSSSQGGGRSGSNGQSTMENKNQQLNKEIVVVHWEDSYAHGGQKMEEEWKDYGTGFCVSAGILVKEDMNHITLAQDLFYSQPPTVEGDQFRNVFSIPKRCIVKMEKFSCPIEYARVQRENIYPKEQIPPGS